MGEPIRLRRSGPPRPQPGSSFSNRYRDERTRNTDTTSTSQLVKALQRQEDLLKSGLSLGEGDISKIVTDPEHLERVKKLMTDAEIQDIFGVYEPGAISAIRSSSSLTDLAQQNRLAELAKEREEGTRELEADKNSNMFFKALSAIVETIAGEEDSKRRTALKHTPVVGDVVGVLSAVEKGEKLIDNVNKRGEQWDYEHGYETKADRQARTTEEGFSWKKLPQQVALGMVGADDPGKKPWDLKAQVMGHEWNIPFVQTNGLAAGVIADLYEMDALGTPEGRRKGYAEFKRLYAETKDYNRSMIDSWRARDDISWWQKEGIILGSDPSVVWGGALAAAKAPLQGWKAGTGLYRGYRNAKDLKNSVLDLGDYTEIKAGIEQKIRAGVDDDFWDEAHDADLDGYARSIHDQDDFYRVSREEIDSEIIYGQSYDEAVKRRDRLGARLRVQEGESSSASAFGVRVDDWVMSLRARIGDEDIGLRSLDSSDINALEKELEPWAEHLDSFDNIPEDVGDAADWLVAQKSRVVDDETLALNEWKLLNDSIAKHNEKLRLLDEDEAADILRIKDDIRDPKSGFWDEHPALLSEVVEKELDGVDFTLMKVGDISPNSELLSRNSVTPNNAIHSSGKLAAIGMPARLMNPSSEIGTLAEGSIDRVVLEGKVIHGRSLDEGDSHLSVIMSQFRSMGEWFGPVDLKAKNQAGARKWYGAKRRDDRYIFEIGEGKKVPEVDEAGKVKPETVDKDEGRLWGITPRRGQKGASVYFNDVFEIGPLMDDTGTIRLKSGREHRNSIYAGLTDRQNDAIDMMQDFYKQMLKIAEREGLDLNELGSMDEAFAFISRKVKGDTEGLLNIGRRKVTPGFFKSRVYESMKEGVLDGKKYFNPTETAEMYGKAMYRLIADKRMQNWIIDTLDPEFVKSTDLKTTNPKLVSHYDAVANTVKAQDSAVRNLGQHADGRVLTLAEQKAMKKAFPEMADSLDALWRSGKALEPQSLARHIQKAMKGKTTKQVNEAIESIKGGRKTMSKTDVAAVLKALGADLDKMQKGTIELIIEQGTKSQKEAYSSRARAMQQEMMARLKINENRLSMAQGKKSAATEKLRSLEPGEAQPSKLRLTLKGEGASKAAEDIDSWLNTSGYPPLKLMTKLNDAIRLLKTGWDFGVFFIQGLPILFKDPETWGEAMSTSIMSFVDEGVRARYIADNAGDITDFIRHGGHIGSTEMTQSMESGGWFAKLPTVFGESRQPILKGVNRAAQVTYRTSRRFQSQYDTFLDVARFELFKSLKPSWVRNGKVSDLDDLADFVNKVSGHTSTRALGVGTTQRELEGALFLFSPRYTRATAALFMDMFSGGMRATEARSAIAHLMVSQYALHMAVSAATGKEPNLTPGTGMWLKTEIPGVGGIGFGGKPNSIINMMADVQRQLQKNPSGFMSWDITNPESYEKNSLLKRLRYQTSPVTTTMLNMVTGTDPIGRKLPDWEDIWLDDAGNPEFDMEALKSRAISSGLRYLPFMVEGWYESGPIGGVGEFTGAMVYPERSYIARDNLYDKYARQDFGMSYEELRKRNDFETKKSVLEQAHPDLREAVQTAREDQREFRRNDERMVVRDQRDAAVTHLAKEWDSAGKEFLTMGGDGRTFRQRFWEANGVYGEKMKALRTAHPDLYADMTAYYEGKGISNEVQAATNAMMDRMFSPEAQDWFGNTDYAAIDRIKSDLTKVYGEDVMNNVERNFTNRMVQRAGGDEAAPVVTEMIRSIEGLRRYWDAGREGVSEQDWRMWLAYDNSNRVAKEALKHTSLPDSGYSLDTFEKIIDEERQFIQQQSADIDKWLVLFYGKEALHYENMV